MENKEAKKEKRFANLKREEKLIKMIKTIKLRCEDEFTKTSLVFKTNDDNGEIVPLSSYFHLDNGFNKNKFILQGILLSEKGKVMWNPDYEFSNDLNKIAKILIDARRDEKRKLAKKEIVDVDNNNEEIIKKTNSAIQLLNDIDVEENKVDHIKTFQNAFLSNRNHQEILRSNDYYFEIGKLLAKLVDEDGSVFDEIRNRDYSLKIPVNTNSNSENK